MSEQEQHVGKAKLICKDNNEEFLEKLATEKGWTRESYHSSWAQCVADEGHETHVVTDFGTYEIIEREEMDGYDDLYIANPIDEETVSFVLKFYNGGTCFSEALEQALKDMKKAA